MKEFNTFGPTYPQLHYHIDRQAIKAQIHGKIDRARYFTLNAARQIGKTTVFQETVEELEAGQKYFCIYLDFEELVGSEGTLLYEVLGDLLEEWREYYEPSAPEPIPMSNHNDFMSWLRLTSKTLGKQGVLIIDEFEAVPKDILMPLLSRFRGMYISRLQPNKYSLRSIVLVGVRTIASLLEGTQSPFNIADQFTIPYFTLEETTNLLLQHSEATGQPFEPATIQAIYDQSQGQPFLVNRLAKILTEEIAPLDKANGTDPATQSITMRHFEQALLLLVNENNSHFYTIISKAELHKSTLMPMLFYSQGKTNFREAATADLLMYGLLRISKDEHGLQVARIANPIYRTILLMTFMPNIDEVYQPNGTVRHRYLVDGHLDFAGLLDSFKEFMVEHGVRLLKSAKTGRPLELSGQYLLLSFLTAALNSIQGFAAIEAMSDAGEIDILVFFRGQRFIVETKIWRGNAKFEEGKTQLTDYLQASALDEGYLIIFDDKLSTNSLIPTHGERFETTHNGKLLQVYLVPVGII